MSERDTSRRREAPSVRQESVVGFRRYSEGNRVDGAAPGSLPKQVYTRTEGLRPVSKELGAGKR